MTFSQRLFGKYYKWWYILVYKFKSRSVSTFDNILFVIGHLLVLSGTLITWWLANNKVIDQTLQERWTYFVIGELFLSCIYTFPEFFAFQILRGQHVTSLLRPQNFLSIKFFDYYGEGTLQNLVKFILLLALAGCMIALNYLTYFQVNQVANLLIFIPISLVIMFMIGIMVSFSAFFMPQVNGVILNFAFLSNLLMGRLFPLDLVISNFWINLGNPFAYLFYHPMQVYFGKYNPIETSLAVGGGIIWCLLLTFLANILLRLGLKRNESIGL